jgi:hypothetical protein
MSEWHKREVGEVATFFDVDLNTGLSTDDVLKRIKKFGTYHDLSISKELESLLAVRVRRQGQIKKIGIANLVPGDIVVLEEGKRVPAEIRLFQVKALRIDQSLITGEALPSEKNTFATNNAEKQKQKCMAFKGSFVKSGSGFGIVCDISTNSPNGQKPKKYAKFLNRKLTKNGIIVQSQEAVKIIKYIDMILVDTNMIGQQMLDLITKIQMAKNIQCKFIVESDVALKLKKDLNGAIIYDGRDVVNHNPKHIANTIEESQFITDITPTSLFKIFSALRLNGWRFMYVCEGHQNPDVLRAADVSLLVGSYGRDDAIFLADLIAPKVGPLILDSILHNKF